MTALLNKAIENDNRVLAAKISELKTMQRDLGQMVQYLKEFDTSEHAQSAIRNLLAAFSEINEINIKLIRNE